MPTTAGKERLCTDVKVLPEQLAELCIRDPARVLHMHLRLACIPQYYVPGCSLAAACMAYPSLFCR